MHPGTLRSIVFKLGDYNISHFDYGKQPHQNYCLHYIISIFSMQEANPILSKYTGHCKEVTSSLGQNFFLPSDKQSMREEASDLQYVIIAFTNRSGSNYLSQLLSSTKKINCGQEFLNAEDIVLISKKQKIYSFEDYFYKIALANSVNNLFAFKAALPHFYMLEKVNLLKTILSKSCILHIERSDKISQAISLEIASRTGHWTSYQGDLNSLQALTFDPKSIDLRLNEILVQSNDITSFISRTGAQNLNISYELLMSCTDAVMQTVAKHINIQDAAISHEFVKTLKQATRLNSEWKHMFLTYLESIPLISGK